MSFHSMIQSTSFTNYIIRAAALLAALWLTPVVSAVTLYWDADGTLEGSGAWDANSTQNWSTTNVAGAPDSKWDPNDGTVDAAFGGTLAASPPGDGTGSTNGRVTVSGTINVDSITLAPTANSYAISGGTLHITNPTNSIVMSTILSGANRAQIIASQITGTDITVFADNGGGSANALLTLGAPGTGVTNTFTGDLIFGGPSTASVGLSQININNPTALPSTATVRMQRNLSQLLFGAGGASGSTTFTATFNNNIILNDGGSGTLTQSIGSFSNGTVITLGGVISGNAGLTFQLGAGGGQGKIVLTNHATYTGPTQINTAAAKTGIVSLGISDALPIGTTFTESRGNFDMAGFNQQVGGLSGSGGNGVVSNTSGTISTLTISGKVIGDYSGLIGATSGSLLPGSNDNVALNLASTNTGSLSLSLAAGNTYNGGTTISGGKLYANNDANAVGSATGTGTVTINGTGVLAGSGSVGGAITVASGGHLSAGQRVGNLIGTLIAFNAVSLSSGSNLDIDVGAPAPSGGASDQISLNGFFGNFPLTVPAATHSVGVNFSDPNGGAAGNGTYTLMTFQAGQYTGSTNASQFYTAASPTPNSLNGVTIAYHLADSSNTIVDGTPASATRLIAIVSGGPNALLWTGTNNGNWDTGINANFTNVGTNASTNFAGNDNVTFDDNGANTDPVTIATGGVQPNIVTINNSNVSYSFSGGDIKGSSVGGTGGLFLKGTGAVTINSNYTAAGPISSSKTTATGTVTINGNITAATSLTLNSGTMTLSGANTYSGANTVNGGTLTVSGSSATFGHGDLTVSAGHAAIAAGVSDAIFNSATLTLAGGGTANMADIGYIDLAAGINETIGMLVLGTTIEPAGTYGAMGSGATNIFDEYFSGSGIITVAGAALPGDYNHNGVVDAADYVVWRNGGSPNPNSPADYNTWRANFGATAGGGAGISANTNVPEPATLLPAMIAATLGWCVRRRQWDGSRIRRSRA